jgi:23S rRNA (guanosine2251-2'-O)-methyltransferase
MVSPFYIYGIHPVLEFLRTSPHQVQRVLVSESARDQKLDEIYQLVREADLRLERLERNEFERIAGDGVHQGVAVQMAPIEYADIDDLLVKAEEKGEKPLIVALDQVQDPHNFGAIARSAFAFGAHGLLVGKNRSCPITGTVIKASAGAIAHLPIAQVTNLSQGLDRLKKKGLWVVGTVAQHAQPLASVDLTDAIVLVIGSEGKGLREKTEKLCDFRAHIPMPGNLGSLNASVAAGVCLYETARQRSSAQP